MADFVSRTGPQNTTHAAPPTVPATPPNATASSSATTGTGVIRCTSLPHSCEVTHTDLQDAVLLGDYDQLPPLRLGQLIPWSEMTGPGQMTFSAWAEHCPNMNGEMAYNALSFVEDTNFMNPSRSSPVNLEVREVPGLNRHHLYRNGHPVVGVSAVFLEHSQIMTPSTSGLTQKFIRGILHSQEWERFVAWVCMAFGQPALHAQLAKDALQFSTRPRFDSKDDNKKKTKNLFTNTRSPSTRSANSPNRITADTFALPTDGYIPVYDARSSPFDFHHDLPNISSLPHWQGDIPYGSFVVVGFTLTMYRAKNGNMTLACNIQWAVVVGVPDEDL
ncbi:hypothetical protein EST38_g13051 [Candolleomyces aberdarensis]|uniref:Uncharacterized protein n=1 Tax=Candolleomyces aberdarensis TaxID=2316362 RepID=A0A4Q2D376_9AGAR|nr:hypothetical protein EST38_g13051 [Candolleomyces aberdarensis]